MKDKDLLETKAQGYRVENGKLVYFSNMLNGYRHEYKDLQEICTEMNGLLKKFNSYEEQLAFWKGKAEEKIPENSVVVSKEWWDKSRTQKTFKFYKDENLSKELYLTPYSVCIRPSDDNMSLLSLYKTLVWCGYASENYWDWCENTKEAKEVSFYEYIDELIKAIQDQASKEMAEKIWLQAKTIVDKTKHLVQGREYLHIDALKEIVKSVGVEIKE